DVLAAAGHLGLARGRVDDHLALEPAVDGRARGTDLGEAGARGVLARTVIPVAAVGGLELDAAHRVQALLSVGRARVEDEDGGGVTAGASGVQAEEQAVMRVVLFGGAPAAADPARGQGPV